MLYIYKYICFAGMCQQIFIEVYEMVEDHPKKREAIQVE